MPASYKVHAQPVFVSANPSRAYNERCARTATRPHAHRLAPLPRACRAPVDRSLASDRTRTALGASIHWWPAYNDGVKNDKLGLGIGFGEVTRQDNRAAGGGPAAWGAPGAHNRVLWDEKFTGPNRAGSNPTAWIETRSGITSDVRDQLLREKENKPKGAFVGLPTPESAKKMAAVQETESQPSPSKWTTARDDPKYFDQLTKQLGPPWNAPVRKVANFASTR